MIISRSDFHLPDLWWDPGPESPPFMGKREWRESSAITGLRKYSAESSFPSSTYLTQGGETTRRSQEQYLTFNTLYAINFIMISSKMLKDSYITSLFPIAYDCISLTDNLPHIMPTDSDLSSCQTMIDTQQSKAEKSLYLLWDILYQENKLLFPNEGDRGQIQIVSGNSVDTPVLTKYGMFHSRLLSIGYMNSVGQVHARPYSYMAWYEMTGDIRCLSCIYKYIYIYTYIYIWLKCTHIYNPLMNIRACDCLLKYGSFWWILY